jgi:ABC-type uncharacterized transport system permease subunit
VKLKLKENPKEWRNFTLIFCTVILALCALAARKDVRRDVVVCGCAFAAIVGLVAIWYPPAVRGLYRGVMTISFWVGQTMGKVMLGAIYLLLVTPLGLALRVVGKDPLEIRRVKEKASYWKEARPPGDFEKQF